jgi:hypothetical protein
MVFRFAPVAGSIIQTTHKGDHMRQDKLRAASAKRGEDPFKDTGPLA